MANKLTVHGAVNFATFFIGRIVDGAVVVSQIIPGAAPLDSFRRALDRLVAADRPG